jgi:hypothetical protein
VDFVVNSMERSRGAKFDLIARGVGFLAKGEQIGDFRECKPKLLSAFNEADASHRFGIVQPISGRLSGGLRQQLYSLVVPERLDVYRGFCGDFPDSHVLSPCSSSQG